MDRLFDTATIRRFLASVSSADAESVRFALQPLQGGLESAVCVIQESGGSESPRFVVKRVSGGQRREADAYAALQRSGYVYAPKLHAVEPGEHDALYLFIDWIQTVDPWPWQNLTHAEALVDALAHLHSSDISPSTESLWDYDSALIDAGRTAAATIQGMSAPDMVRVRRGRAAVAAISAALPQIRQWMHEDGRFRPCFIHGDAHPGNAMVPGGEGSLPLLLDWGRCRSGSPLEDLSSWLQTLGLWEPQARRRHDALFRRYLAARGLPPLLDRRTRDHYWLAAACNVMAGALTYRLWVAGECAPGSPERAEAVRLAEDCVRIVVRAHRCWRRIQGDSATSPAAV